MKPVYLRFNQTVEAMADNTFSPGDRGRRRRRRGMRREYEDDYYHSSSSSASHSSSSTQPPARTPIILAKPPDRPSNGGSPSLGEDLATSPRSNDPISADNTEPSKPAVVMLRNRDDSAGSQFHASSAQSIPNMLAGDALPSQVYQVQRRISNPASNSSSQGGEKFSIGPDMSHCIKLVDCSLNWSEAGTEWLLDQTDFLVIGTIGMQSAGKSTIMSHLSSGPITRRNRSQHAFYSSSNVFPSQTRETREICNHQTQGIDMFVTPERTIYLDTQPILSTSVLDQLIRHDYKYPAEFTSTENCIEMQSLQMASFLMTVCHVIVVVLDGLADLTNFRFLQTAEMLKPVTPPPHNSSSDTSSEYYPHIVFVVNRASRESMNADGYQLIQRTIQQLMNDSKLKFKGVCSMSHGQMIAGLPQGHSQGSVNVILIPEINSNGKQHHTDPLLSFLPAYQGHPGFEATIDNMSEQILSIPRCQLTHTTLSEKNWFHYAARTWEGVKKSTLFAEYNRLLP